MFDIFKISLFGIFILLISTQTFAQRPDPWECNQKKYDTVRILDETYTTSKRDLMRFCPELKGDSGDFSMTFVLENTVYAREGHMCFTSQADTLKKLKSGSMQISEYKLFSNASNSCKDFLTKEWGLLSPAELEKLQRAKAAQEAQQAQQLKQRAQESQQQAQQNQQRADQERQGYRKTHDPDNEAHDCLMHAKESKQFGGFTNSCNYKVDFLYCNYKPKPGSGADIVDCQKGKMGSLTIGAKSQTDDHTNKNGETYWFACKSPARAVDGEFVEGKGISARCDSADGRANQTRVGSSIKKQQRNPQTISQGPVSVTLIPTNNTSSKCYDIAYENRSDKHVDIFLKFSLTNNKTGEKGTSVWLGDNTNFDGLFGSANTNRLNPKTSMETTKTVMYNHWLMAKNFIFNNQPSDLYGFNNTVENCDDITAEIPSGGLKWNENAYQRHFDACRSPIKRNRPVGC